MNLSSFSVVATKECMKELAVLLFSIRQIYSEPVYILCDSQTKSYIETFGWKNLRFNLSADPEGLAKATEKVKGINLENSFHSAAKIYLKMDCLEWAVIESGNSLFLDADIILSKPVHSDLSNDYDVILSPHYHPTNTLEQNKKYGAFNAGYLWANDQYVAQIWRDIYMTRSSFYEQQGMIWFFEYLDTGVFDKSHNFGFCRFVKEWVNENIHVKDPTHTFQNAKSYHFHSIPETYQNADDGLKKGYESLYRTLYPCLPAPIKDFIHKVRYES